MTIEITKAVKERWTAKSLSNSVTGGIHHGRPPAKSAMPYCIYNEITANPIGNTNCYRNGRMELQFDIYTDDGDPETCADLAVLVRDAFVNADRATSSPFNPTGGVSISEVRLSQDIVTMAEGEEQVFRSRFGLVVAYSTSANWTPA